MSLNRIVTRCRNRSIEAFRTQRRVCSSAPSLWEISIKNRLGKLPLSLPISEWPSFLADSRLELVEIRVAHIVADLDPMPDTKDPFDRLIAATAMVEGLKLVTVDRALLRLPLAWRP